MAVPMTRERLSEWRRAADIGRVARRRGLSRRPSAGVQRDNRTMDKRGSDGRACSPVLDMRSVGDTVKQEPMAKPQPVASDRIILAERRETNPREETTSKRRRGSTDDEAITAANRGGGGEGEGTADENDWEDGGRLVTRRSS
ncbi:PREDICTED: uncharacterized protein LOC106815818, partial [Priapulus caudatus]|uniref:Uncharacterized protein LOC106815818 n=1 Tax=Priapulus caudatus TaxID=37621 RepID=A0ABM1EUE4_PRICU